MWHDTKDGTPFNVKQFTHTQSAHTFTDTSTKSFSVHYCISDHEPPGWFFVRTERDALSLFSLKSQYRTLMKIHINLTAMLCIYMCMPGMSNVCYQSTSPPQLKNVHERKWTIWLTEVWRTVHFHQFHLRLIRSLLLLSLQVYPILHRPDPLLQWMLHQGQKTGIVPYLRLAVAGAKCSLLLVRLTSWGGG